MPPAIDNAGAERLRSIFWDNINEASHRLDDSAGGDADPVVSRAIDEHIGMMTQMLEMSYARMDPNNAASHSAGGLHMLEGYDRELLHCFDMERDVLARRLSAGEISEDDAASVRIRINTLENHAIENVDTSKLGEHMAHKAQRAAKRHGKMRRNRAVMKNRHNKNNK
jgi:hypothetical protein